MKEVIDLTKNYKILALAIIKRAIIDYEDAKKKKEENKIASIKRFFYSEWFSFLSDSDGPSIFKRIENNFDTYKKCMPFKEENEEE